MSTENNSYYPKCELFRALALSEVKLFQEYAHKLSIRDEGGELPLSIIHPVVRKELIRMIEESLKVQGEL